MKTLKVSATMASMLKTLIQTPQNPLIHKLPRTIPLEKPPLFLSFSQRHFTKQVVCNSPAPPPPPRCSSENNDSSSEQYPRPSDIQWRKDISNSVQFIGITDFPVLITPLSSGKVVGSTRLTVLTSATNTHYLRIYLAFWDELAHIAHQHVEKGNQIYVSGRLTSDTVECEDFSNSVQWRKDISNSVQVIGIADFPVKIITLSCGTVAASTFLTVLTSATESFRINLSFWDELAHIAHQHVQKGNQIYVSGRLESAIVVREAGKKQTYYRVIVQQLNFVEGSSPSPVPLYDDSYGSAAAAAKSNSSAPPTKLSIEDLWQAFFANPAEWWDNRKNKKNPRAPDFKQKTTGEVLWVEDRNCPPWVKSKLEVLDSKM